MESTPHPTWEQDRSYTRRGARAIAALLSYQAGTSEPAFFQLLSGNPCRHPRMRPGQPVGPMPALPSGCVSRPSPRGARLLAIGSRGSWRTAACPTRSCGGTSSRTTRFSTPSFGWWRAIVKAPSLADRIPLGRFLGAVSSDENTYFHRAFDALNVPKVDRTRATLPDNPRVPRRDVGCHQR